ncbi:MAG: discoidin domain-containing protein [Sedimentisphaerales bacterium]|nr:discoidin domain-containing protein [Sedimentisphaerales bacterium]
MIKNKAILSLFVVGLVALMLMVPSCKKSANNSSDPKVTDTKDCGCGENCGCGGAKAKTDGEKADEQPAGTEEQPAGDTEQSAGTTEQPTGATDLVPLEIKLPKPMFVGTPTNINIENLEKPLGKARPLLQVPQGVTLLSLNKPVASSDDEPIIGDLEQADDGDKEGIDGSWVELGPGKQWLQIDLEKPAEIYAIVIWHYHRQGQIYKDVVVQVADDADFISNVRTLFNNDIDNSSGLGIGQDMHYVETAEGKLIPVKGVKAQYVRFYSNGNTSNDLNHYTEIEIFGK